MNLEELTKTQIILLALLVSFMTSIATGIVTVTLMDQAPPALTQTINRVVERTVERVVPSESQAGVVTKETEVTVVVKEDDLITESIETAKASLVRIRLAPEFVEAGTNSFVSLGFIVDGKGIIVTDATPIAKLAKYKVALSDGSVLDATVLEEFADGVALLKMELSSTSPKLASLALASKEPKLGQTVIGLSGLDRVKVSTGIVSGTLAGKPTEDKSSSSFIETTITEALAGSPLINIFGEVVGFSSGPSRESGGGSSYTGAASVINALKSLIATSTSPS